MVIVQPSLSLFMGKVIMWQVNADPNLQATSGFIVEEDLENFMELTLSNVLWSCWRLQLSLYKWLLNNKVLLRS